MQISPSLAYVKPESEKKKKPDSYSNKFYKMYFNINGTEEIVWKQKKSTSEVKDYKGKVNEGNHEQKLDIDKQKEYSSVIVTSG